MAEALILGAGFSKAAGLPLTKELFDQLPVEPSEHQNLLAQHESVRAAWIHWSSLNPGKGTEEWMSELYSNRETDGSIWPKVLRFLTARLVLGLKERQKAEYFHDVFTSVQSDIHRQFWTRILKEGEIRTVVTTNYDILIEQGLRPRYESDRYAPLCHYGGMPGPEQWYRKMLNPIKNESEAVLMGNDISLFKLHGSLNWAFEPHDFKIHGDLRAAFRKTTKAGHVAIVPPIPEKQLPEDFAVVWKYAGQALRKSRSWLVCGYSFPTYDIAVQAFFRDAIREGVVERIAILDPWAADIEKKLLSYKPSLTVKTLPGLQDALSLASW